MWIMTNRGFYSAVELPEKFRLSERTHLDIQVRARDREALEVLVADLLATNDGFDVVGPILDLPGHDYGYRVYVERDAFSVWVGRQVQHIDYGNFKASVTDDQLHHVYNAVWATIANLYGSGQQWMRPSRAKARNKR